jgi:hypothetical protein
VCGLIQRAKYSPIQTINRSSPLSVAWAAILEVKLARPTLTGGRESTAMKVESRGEGQRDLRLGDSWDWSLSSLDSNGDASR